MSQQYQCSENIAMSRASFVSRVTVSSLSVTYQLQVSHKILSWLLWEAIASSSHSFPLFSSLFYSIVIHVVSMEPLISQSLIKLLPTQVSLIAPPLRTHVPFQVIYFTLFFLLPLYCAPRFTPSFQSVLFFSSFFLTKVFLSINLLFRHFLEVIIFHSIKSCLFHRAHFTLARHNSLQSSPFSLMLHWTVNDLFLLFFILTRALLVLFYCSCYSSLA